MKQFLLSVVLLSGAAYAEPAKVNKVVVCDRAPIVMEELAKTYGERPIWIGAKDDSKVAVLVNPKSGSWSVIQFDDANACVIDVGEGFQFNAALLGKSVKL